MSGTGIAAALVATVVLSVAAEAGGSTSTRPAVTPNAIWGWVVARRPSTASYTPSASNQGNSSGGTDHVIHSGRGQYLVLFPGVGESRGGGNGGVVDVTALDDGPHACAAGAWTGNQDEQVNVTCRDALGHLADAAFILNWVDAALDDGEMAYVLTANASTGGIAPNHSF